MIELTDSETAVTLDCLIIKRDEFKKKSIPCPNIESAILKIQSEIKINTYGLTITGINK